MDTQLQLLEKLEEANIIDISGIAFYKNGEKIDHLEGASPQEIAFLMLQASVKDNYSVEIEFTKNPSREADWETFEQMEA